MLSAFALLGATSASATILSLGLDIEFSGGQAPGGATPWVTTLFDDNTGNPDTVLLTMSTSGLMGNGNTGEYLANLHFNFDPSLNPNNLIFTPINMGNVGATTVSTGVDAFMADGDGFFDILFDFPPAPGPPPVRFMGGLVVTYEIFFSGGIDVNSFNFFSVMGAGQGTFVVGGQVQNTTGAGSGGSGWIGAVPEPGTATLVGMGLIALSIGQRRRAPGRSPSASRRQPRG
jgi:hypothetical protein